MTIDISLITHCRECGSPEINHNLHSRDGSEPELCDVCFWRSKALKYKHIIQETSQQIMNLMNKLQQSIKGISK